MMTRQAPVKNVKELRVYQLAYELAMQIFKASRAFLAEEKYSLTDQMRRCSRAVCANLSEAWAKRRYEAHFVSKLSDADAENMETSTWLDFAKDCGYLNDTQHAQFLEMNVQIGAMLGKMMQNSASWCSTSRPPSPAD